MKTRTNRDHSGSALSVVAASVVALGSLAAACSYDWTVTDDEMATASSSSSSSTSSSTSSSSSGDPSGPLPPCSCPSCIECGELMCNSGGDVAECVRFEECVSVCGGNFACESECVSRFIAGYALLSCLEQRCDEPCAVCLQGL